jgi:hypothetical protein
MPDTDVWNFVHKITKIILTSFGQLDQTPSLVVSLAVHRRTPVLRNLHSLPQQNVPEVNQHRPPLHSLPQQNVPEVDQHRPALQSALTVSNSLCAEQTD